MRILRTFAAGIALSSIAAPALAADTLYNISFSLTGLNGPITTMSGSGSFVFDPVSGASVQDIVPTTFTLAQNAFLFTSENTRIDTFLEGDNRVFIVGGTPGGGNNTLIANLGDDFRTRLTVNSSGVLVGANAGYVFNRTIYTTNDALAGSTFSLSPAVTAAVPEPATWAMILIGFGAIGATMRHRLRAKALPQMA